MASHEYILALDGLPGIESEIGEYLEHINVQTKRYMGNSIHERIVRCRDCRLAKWKANDCDGNEIYRCDRQIYCEVTADGFCAWGERREVE